MSSKMSRWLVLLAVVSVAVLGLLAGVAMAGGGSGGGADNGTKNGTSNKKQTFTCPSDYSLTYSPGSPYDLNRDLYVCTKDVGNGSTYTIDDTTSTTP